MRNSAAALASVTSSAGAKALNAARCLAEDAPAGRFFSTIATLVDASRSAETGFAAGDLPRAERAVAALDLASDHAQGKPAFLKRA